MGAGGAIARDSRSFEPPFPIISIFGSSRVPEAGEAFRQAHELGSALARAGFAVATGGYSGVMEAVSWGAAEAGGRVLGVVARQLPGKANRWVKEEIVVDSWEQRLMKLIELGEGYVACAGGTGTLVELAVAWEQMHKGLLPRRPLVVLGSFWTPIVRQIEAAEESARGAVLAADAVSAVVEILQKGLGKKSGFPRSERKL